jgi:hypothetical protein
MKAPWYAIYSAEAARECGGVVEWLREDGTPVICTCVHREPDCSDYRWEDKELRGPVVSFSRVVVPSKLEWGIHDWGYR